MQDITDTSVPQHSLLTIICSLVITALIHKMITK